MGRSWKVGRAKRAALSKCMTWSNVGSLTQKSRSVQSALWSAVCRRRNRSSSLYRSQPHFPTLPNPAFAGKTGNGDWADMLAEMDHNVGQMLEAVDKLGIRDNTIVIFTSDNGGEFVQPWDGWAGPWRGQYFTALEGGIRVPFMISWPGKVPAGRVSNETVHGVDLFPTLAKIAGAKVPSDRAIDGVDQSDFFLGKSEKSNREGFPIWVDDRLQAVKLRNWKLHLYTMTDPPVKLGVPNLYNLYTDPREEKPVVDTWVAHPMFKIIGEFEQSLTRYPLIPMGTPDPYDPSQTKNNPPAPLPVTERPV
jgi:hypothetical protein